MKTPSRSLGLALWVVGFLGATLAGVHSQPIERSASVAEVAEIDLQIKQTEELISKQKKQIVEARAAFKKLISTLPKNAVPVCGDISVEMEEFLGKLQSHLDDLKKQKRAALRPAEATADPKAASSPSSPARR